MQPIVQTRFAKSLLVIFLSLGLYAAFVVGPTSAQPYDPPQSALASPYEQTTSDSSLASLGEQEMTLVPSQSTQGTTPKNATKVKHAPDDSRVEDRQKPVPSQDLNATALANYSYDPDGNSHFGVDHFKFQLPRYTLKESQWWPQLAYSRLRFELTLLPCEWPSNCWYDVFVNLLSQGDPYCRTFRVFVDTINKYQTTICPPGFSQRISGIMIAGGCCNTHKLEFEIQWGFYSQKGWKLTEMFVLYQPYPYFNLESDYEYFPKTDTTSNMTWQVKLGTDSKLEVNIQQVNDPYTRCLRVYVDEVMKTGTCSYIVPGSFTIPLGNYAKGSEHWLKLEIKWGFYSEYGWRIVLNGFRVHYAAVSVEVDHMPGRDPIQDVLNYIQTYYIDHGPERVTFVLDGTVTEDRLLTTTEYYSNYVDANPSTFGHKEDPMWKYVIFGWYYSEDNQNALPTLGWASGGSSPGVTGTFVFIADKTIEDCVGFCFCQWWGCYGFGWLRNEVQIHKTVMMQEFGHDLGMVHNTVWSASAMYSPANLDNVFDYPYYTLGDWEQRRFP